MYNNVGAKLKGLAKFLAWFGIIGSCISGITIMAAGSSISYYGAYGSSSLAGGGLVGGIIIMVIGSLASWLSSLALYGFGEMIENVASMNDKLSSIQASERDRDRN